jgi:exodeoxyribonuclease VIII
VDIKEIQKQISNLQKLIADNNERMHHCDDPKAFREYGSVISSQKQELNKLVDLLAQAQALQTDSPDFDDDAPDFDPAPVVYTVKPKQQTGIFYGMSNEEYHSSSGISKSGLDFVAGNPSDYDWYKNAPVDKSKLFTLDNGSFLHCLLGEPGEIEKIFVRAPEVNMRTNAGKAEMAEFKQSNQGKTIISDDDWLMMHLMRDSALAHPTVRMIMEAEGANEVSIFWNDKETGELLRVRPDRLIWLGGEPVIVDWKSVAGLDRFETNAERHRYHVQDAMYRDGVMNHFNMNDRPDFWFVPISSSINCGRYPVTVTQLPADWAADGHRIYREDLKKYNHCRINNDWLHVSTMKRPRWA